jgi:hypothetical protein
MHAANRHLPCPLPLPVVDKYISLTMSVMVSYKRPKYRNIVIFVFPPCPDHPNLHMSWKKYYYNPKKEKNI